MSLIDRIRERRRARESARNAERTPASEPPAPQIPEPVPEPEPEPIPAPIPPPAPAPAPQIPAPLPAPIPEPQIPIPEPPPIPRITEPPILPIPLPSPIFRGAERATPGPPIVAQSSAVAEVTSIAAAITTLATIANTPLPSPGQPAIAVLEASASPTETWIAKAQESGMPGQVQTTIFVVIGVIVFVLVVVFGLGYYLRKKLLHRKSGGIDGMDSSKLSIGKFVDSSYLNFKEFEDNDQVRDSVRSSWKKSVQSSHLSQGTYPQSGHLSNASGFSFASEHFEGEIEEPVPLLTADIQNSSKLSLSRFSNLSDLLNLAAPDPRHSVQSANSDESLSNYISTQPVRENVGIQRMTNISTRSSNLVRESMKSGVSEESLSRYLPPPYDRSSVGIKRMTQSTARSSTMPVRESMKSTVSDESLSRESPPASPEPRRRGTLSGLFDQLSLTSSRRKSKPLPLPPPDLSISSQPPVIISNPEPVKPLKPLLPDIKSEKDIKRVCIPEQSTTITTLTKVKTTDNNGLQELFYYRQDSRQKLRGCCVDSQGFVGCCTLCNHDQWIFQGSEYQPFITLLYAQMDGCIPSSVKLVNAKFIIPWRYKNRRSGRVSWKIIHMCGSNIEDAECETIVVNPYRDKKLRRIIETVKTEAVWYQGSVLVEYLLKVIRLALGNYGLPGGATSSQADSSLFAQLKSYFILIRQGHNFMMLGNVKIGLCRHKALLFKILCDTVGLECDLITGYSTGGRHQWNIITLKEGNKSESYIIDPTSPHFTWTKQGSVRMKAYKIEPETSFGHGGITMKLNGIL